MAISPIGNFDLRDGVQVWNKTAYNPALSSAATVTPQGGTYPWPASAGQPTVVSSSADDAAAGDGARTVVVTYLDEDYAEQTETVTLNGTSAVTMTADDVLRINGVQVATVGADGVSAGNISVKLGSDTVGYIASGNNFNRQGVYTVPAGKKLYVTGFKVGVTHTAANKRSVIGLKKKTGAIFTTSWETALTDGFASADLKFPLAFDEKTDIFWRGSSDGTATVHIFGEGYLDNI